MPVYKYLFCDLMTDFPLAWLDVRAVTFDRRISQAGDFRGQIDIHNRHVADKVATVFPRYAHQIYSGPGRVVCHVYRDSELWGSYVIWRAVPQGDDNGKLTISLEGQHFESVFNRMLITHDIELSNIHYNGAINYLVSDMQYYYYNNTRNRDFGIEITSPWDYEDAPGDAYTDRVYRGYELASYGQRMAELTSTIGGSEWFVKVWQDGYGIRHRELVVAPEVGRENVKMNVTSPGNIISWKYPADYTQSAIRWQTRGDNINTDITDEDRPLLSRWAFGYDPALEVPSHLVWEDVDALITNNRARLDMDHGWPSWEGSSDYQGAKITATLNAYAYWWARNFALPVRIPEATVRIDDRLKDFSPNGLGDWFRIKIVNDIFPLNANNEPTFVYDWRCIGYQVNAPGGDDQEERVTFIFEDRRDHPIQTGLPSGVPGIIGGIATGGSNTIGGS